MKNRVVSNELNSDVIERIPFLAQFISPDNTWTQCLERANAYMGCEFFIFGQRVTAHLLNKILEEAEKRGDI